MAVQDIGPKTAGEQHRVLRNEADAFAHIVAPQAGKPVAVEADGTLRGVVETLNQIKQGALAGARWADQGHHLPRLHCKVDPPQHLRLRARRVGEGKAVDA